MLPLHAYIELCLYLLAFLTLVRPIGWYIYTVMESRQTIMSEIGAPVEHFFYRISGVEAKHSMQWVEYAGALVLFNVFGFLILYGLQSIQAFLPLNPQSIENVAPDSAFNTAMSFITNTNWQSYSGETSLSYLTQMLGLTVQNFFSAATGLCVALAFIRGFASNAAGTIGNFWADLTRSILYIFLPLSFILAILLMGQGVIQNFDPYVAITPLEASLSPHLLPMGPVASQEAIKIIGTNGGGFFNANSAHPFENPTPISNFLQMLSILLIPAGLCYTFGQMVGDRRQGRALFAAMLAIFISMLLFCLYSEQTANPLLSNSGVDASHSHLQPGGNMEGKEVRFGPTSSALFSVITTASSCGATNAALDSFMPLGGLACLLLIQSGEVIFGGVGSGLYGVLIFAIIAVFLAGLMIGRTPEYLGKKIEPFEMKMASFIILLPCFLTLVGTAIALTTSVGLLGIKNPGPHGFTEVLYAFSSAANNNGSAFAGLSSNTPFYNITLGLIMGLGRFGVIIAVLAIAGSLAHKKRLEASVGTLPTNSFLFIGLLIGCIIIIGALSYVPALALGPIIEMLS